MRALELPQFLAGPEVFGEDFHAYLERCWDEIRQVVPNETEATISSNTITLPTGIGFPHVLTVQATGTLKTLSGGAQHDQVIIQAASGVTVTIDNTGNLNLGSFGNFVMGAEQDKAWFFCRDGSNWDALSLRNN